jgi:hypothetical protein
VPIGRIIADMTPSRTSLLIVCALLGLSLTSPPPIAAGARLEYAPAPVDNPLKGLVPYAGKGGTNFPHSLEFNYLPLSGLMSGLDRFTWQPLDRLLDDIAGRGHQAIFRVYLEYPGKPGAVPPFLSEAGVKVTEWIPTDSDRGRRFTPDYTDPRLVSALTHFIAALGARYDGDPRIGFLTAGLLGSWGEWHTHPRPDLWAPKATQIAVLEAYARAFHRTPVLLRYPAGDDDPRQAANAARPFGYHDDSFAWATLDDGQPGHDWYFLSAMRRAGTMDKWRAHPIGGEIRPEVWGRIFDADPGLSGAQDFAACVEQTHVTWLMDSGMFREGNSAERIRRALEQVRRMGYEFHVSETDIRRDGSRLRVRVRIENRGVAPFYHDWPVELGLLDAEGRAHRTWKSGWTLTGILPGASAEREATADLPPDVLNLRVALRVPNPLPNGLPLRCANREQQPSGEAWLGLE